MNDLMIPKIGGVGRADPALLPEAKVPGSPGAPDFKDLLRKTANLEGKPDATEIAGSNPLKFSAHALSRVKDREIPMTSELMSKLEKAVNTAAGKGAKDSLILTKDAAFIVSVKNRTVVTVVDRNQMDGNVFTNIDSTVVV